MVMAPSSEKPLVIGVKKLFFFIYRAFYVIYILATEYLVGLSFFKDLHTYMFAIPEGNDI